MRLSCRNGPFINIYAEQAVFQNMLGILFVKTAVGSSPAIRKNLVCLEEEEPGPARRV